MTEAELMDWSGYAGRATASSTVLWPLSSESHAPQHGAAGSSGSHVSNMLHLGRFCILAQSKDSLADQFCLLNLVNEPPRCDSYPKHECGGLCTPCMLPQRTTLILSGPTEWSLIL